MGQRTKHARARVFWLHFNRLGQKRGQSDIWTIRQGGRNRLASAVQIQVPVQTVYRGDSASQPRAYLRGVGQVKQYGSVVEITK